MNNNMDLHSLIKAQVAKAKNIFTEKDIIESELKETFDLIREAMSNEIIFIFENEVDRYGDVVSTIYASNHNTSKKHTILTYDFDNKTVFPVKITDSNDSSSLCNSLNEIKSFLKLLISDDSFMIRLVAISKEIENLDYSIDDDIPF